MQIRIARIARLAASLALASFVLPAHARQAYVRYPDLNGDRIVFSAEGDLWTASAGGGQARRLTSHVGDEVFARFSPDGGRIAFTGEYDGNRDVFVVPSGGGEPRRLTWHPASDEVVGWTPDGKSILFRSNGEHPHGNNQLYRISPEGGDPVVLPLGWAERIAIDPASGAWAFNRKSWENATWKRYRGGTAPDIWVGHPDKGDFRKVTDFAGINAFPMWHGGRVFYLCDRGGTANLWSMRPDGTDAKRLTSFESWDARWPSMAPDGRIVFTLAADVHVYDPATGTARKVDVDLPSDRTLTRVRYPDPAQNISWLDLSSDGARVLVTARGEIFSVPAKKGVTLPVSGGSAARESWARFDAEGKRIVYVTDATREEEIRTQDAWGRDVPKTVLPADGKWHFPPSFSPDGKWIAYADQTKTLYVIPAGGGPASSVDRGVKGEIREYTWSPDGRWLAYVNPGPNDYLAIHLYDTASGKTTPVTGPTTNDFAPAWDPEGRYLYFASDRATNPILGGRDWNNVEAKNTKLFAVLLRKDVKDPVADLEGLPSGDGDAAKGKDKGKEKSEGKGDDKAKPDEKKPPEPVKIDLDGLIERVVELPVPVGTYGSLEATGKQLFFVSAPLQGFAEGPGLFEEAEPTAVLMAYDLEKKEAKPFVEGIYGFVLAAKADKLAVLKNKGELYVVPAAAPPGGELAKSRVALDGMVLELDPREEWEQIYHETWRLERDFFWDAGMGGLDWREVRDRYAALLPRVASRSDLANLLGEVIGELGNSHTYIFGGDPGKSVRRVPTGLLGADLARDGDAYRIVRIYRGDPADNAVSPLLAPGVGLSEGDYILAVNHRPFPAGLPFHASLEGLAGKMVLLTVNAKASKEGSRDVAVRALPSEGALRYHDWVRTNREYVARKTGGKVGYVHLPDMWKDGLVAFNTWFYPQLDKEGLVVDVRWNGGGAVSQMIVERLRRRLVSFDRSRSGEVSTYPNRVLNGPFVVLTNEFAGSDGDIFPAVVQIEKLAPVIGMRSWGGVVGIRGDKPLVDGGLVTEPEFAWWDPNKGWSIENHGVDPDIEIQNLPQDLARGIDAQLDRAVAETERLRRERPPVKPVFGPVRDRSRGAFARELDGK